MKDFDEIERRLNVTNSQDHPSNQMYKVFHFKTKEQAEYFEELLKSQSIYFESDEEITKEKTLYLFGIRKTDLDAVTRINFLVIGKFRKPFIANAGFKWFVILVGLSALAIALIGFFLKK